MLCSLQELDVENWDMETTSPVNVKRVSLIFYEEFTVEMEANQPFIPMSFVVLIQRSGFE